MVRDGVLVVGSANMDLVVRVERFPLPGETIFGTDFKMFPGGKGANQAVCCAKLGQKVRFVGKMGDDLIRERLSASLEQAGVIIDSLIVDPVEPTGTALITVDKNGENEIVVVSGSNMKLRPADVDGVHDIFGSAAVVLLQLEIPLETVVRAAELAHEQQALLILNPAPACSLPASLLRLVDYLTPNESEAQMLTGIPVTRRSSAEAAAKKLVDQGVKNVLLTLGPEGCLLVNSSRAELFPACRVRPVDTTAAGDAFNGALAFALSRNEELDQAVRFANAVAGYSVTKLGAQRSMPTLTEVEQFMQQLAV
ncbi:MAG: ribokinase [Bacteroidetes bacterium]|nr:ribokinase [Bacteroidota bacterium]